MNNIAKILERKCINFKENYLELSRHLFTNSQNSLSHPGEFGIYREKLVQELIKYFCPTFIEISDGFVTNNKGHVSTQVDIIGYDKDLSVIKNDLNQSFYMCEAVYLIGEVKSLIKKSDIENILKKLTKQRDVINQGRKVTQHPYSQPLTFIVCEKFDFKNPIKELESIYNSIPSCHHNLILSIQDGLFSYYINFGEGDKTMHYPISTEGSKPNLIQIYDNENPTHHINLFVGYIAQHLSSCYRGKIDLVSYLPTSISETLTKVER